MINSSKNTAAVILSGGAGTRLNGIDKGLQKYQDKLLIEHVISRIKPQVNKLYICANRNLEHYQALGFPVCSDEAQNYQGPLSGISSTLKALIIDSEADQLLVSSCDSPHLPYDLKNQLELALLAQKDSDVCVAFDGIRRQNLHCLIRRRAWQPLIHFFNDGGRAMHRWFNQVDTVEADFSNEPDCFNNINTVKQLNSLDG